ncbi:MAG: hypothetical protein M3P98_02865 [bacterium]|nr:hypothetical protein [bacterium]
MSKDNQKIDWSNPEAIETMLSAEGLGDIDKDIVSGPSDHEIMEYYAGVSATTELAIPAVRSTIERYSDDLAGAAIAIHFTGMLAAELTRRDKFAGTLDHNEEDLIDDITSSIQKHGLIGLTIDDLTRAGNINPDMGGLHGLMEIREMLDSMSPELSSHLQERAGTLATELEDNEYENDDFIADLEDEFVDTDENDDNGEEDDSETLVDDSGEEFVI